MLKCISLQITHYGKNETVFHSIMHSCIVLCNKNTFIHQYLPHNHNLCEKSSVHFSNVGTTFEFQFTS